MANLPMLLEANSKDLEFSPTVIKDHWRFLTVEFLAKRTGAVLKDHSLSIMWMRKNNKINFSARIKTTNGPIPTPGHLRGHPSAKQWEKSPLVQTFSPPLAPILPK